MHKVSDNCLNVLYTCALSDILLDIILFCFVLNFLTLSECVDLYIVMGMFIFNFQKHWQPPILWVFQPNYNYAYLLHLWNNFGFHLAGDMDVLKISNIIFSFITCVKYI